MANTKVTKVCYCEETDCFANKRAKKFPDMHICTCLQDNDFGDKRCPFFKTLRDLELSLQVCEIRRKQLKAEKKQKAKETNVRTISGVILKRKEKKA